MHTKVEKLDHPRSRPGYVLSRLNRVRVSDERTQNGFWFNNLDRSTAGPLWAWSRKSHKNAGNGQGLTQNEVQEFKIWNLLTNLCLEFLAWSLKRFLKALCLVMKSVVDVLIPLCSSNHKLTTWTFRSVSVRPLFLFPFQRCSRISSIHWFKTPCSLVIELESFLGFCGTLWNKRAFWREKGCKDLL